MTDLVRKSRNRDPLMDQVEHEDPSSADRTLAPASSGRRIVAYFIDTLVLFFWSVLIFFAALILAPDSASSVPLSLLGLASALAYLFVGWTVWGMTIGKWAVGIRVVAADGSRLSWRRAAARVAAFLVASAPLKLGLAAAFWGERRRGWHDRLAGTMVIRADCRSEPSRAAPRSRRSEEPSASAMQAGATDETAARPTRRGRLIAGLVLAVYLVVAIALTLPLAAHFSTHIPGAQVEGLEQDGYMFLWDYWWVRTAIEEPGLRVMETRFLFWPETVSLRYHTLVLLHSGAAALLQAGLTLIQTYNLLLLFSLAACAWGAFLLCRYVTGSAAAAAVAGLAFGFCPYMTTHALAHQNLIAAEWLAPLAYFALRALREGRLRYVLGAGVSWALVGLCDWYYFLYAAMLLVILLVTEIAARPRRWLPAVAAVAAALVMGAILLSPLLVPMLAERSRGGYMQQPLARGTALAAQPELYLTPAFTHPLFGDSATASLHSLGVSRGEGTVYLGVVVLALALVGLLYRRRQTAPWVVAAVFFLLLALGPYLHVAGRGQFNALALLILGGPPGNGFDLPITSGLSSRLAMLMAGGGSILSAQEPIPLPYLWLWKYVPITRLAAVPTRAVLPGMLALAVCAAAGLQVIVRTMSRRAGRAAAGIAAALIVFEFLPAPYPMRDLQMPQFYRHLANRSSTFAVGEVPLFGDYMVYMYYQTVHHRPLLAGHVSRLPPRALDFVRGNALLRDLQPNRDAQPGEPVLFLTAKVPPDADLEKVRTEYGPALTAARQKDVGVLVIHRSMLTAADMSAVDRLMCGAFGVTGVQEHDGTVVYYLARVAL